MGQCKLCHKSGLFLAVNRQGLCPQCSARFELEKNQKIRIIGESSEIINKSKNLDTQLSRLDLILQYSKDMQIYEKVGIPITNPPLDVIIAECYKYHDQLIMDSLVNEYNLIIQTINTPSVTSTSKINKLNKVLTKAHQYQSKLNKSDFLDSFISRVESVIHKVQLKSYITDAEKYEFKGSTKKALDKYMDALYFLRTDDIDDSLQQKEINKLETKIDELKEK